MSFINIDGFSLSHLVCPQVAELLAGVPAPVVYWEQGHEWVFGDPIRFQVRAMPAVSSLETLDALLSLHAPQSCVQ